MPIYIIQKLDVDADGVRLDVCRVADLYRIMDNDRISLRLLGCRARLESGTDDTSCHETGYGKSNMSFIQFHIRK